MTLHDTYARVTPFEVAFPDRAGVEALIAAVAEEARGRDTDPSNPQAFITMGAVGAFVRELQGPDTPAEAVHQYSALVYHATHFTAAGCPLYLLGTNAARHLVEGVPEGEPVPPSQAGYLQLPQHLFWTTGTEASPTESIDGLFWTATESGTLHVLIVSGVRPDRPGFGTIPIPEAPIAEAGDWLDAAVRQDGTDFSSSVPGGDLDGLYAVEAAGEVLKLLARFFAYVSGVPTAQVPVQPSDTSAGAPAASVLPHVRVKLDG